MLTPPANFLAPKTSLKSRTSSCSDALFVVLPIVGGLRRLEENRGRVYYRRDKQVLLLLHNSSSMFPNKAVSHTNVTRNGVSVRKSHGILTVRLGHAINKPNAASY